MTYTTPPTAAEIEALAEQALAAMPERLARHVSNVSIMVEEAADEEVLAEMGLEHPWELTGLYRGVPLTQRSVDDILRFPDVIVLYREAILIEWVETGEDLRRLVASVLVHEIAHHFGFSDAEIERIEREME